MISDRIKDGGRMICCEVMVDQLTRRECTLHGIDCPDILIRQLAVNVYILPIHDGGRSGVQVHFCPWCAAPLNGKPWYTCETCSYGTNSQEKADQHVEETGHPVGVTLWTTTDASISTAGRRRG